METATFGGGCFWCTEGIFRTIKGVENVTSGYSGGVVENPTDIQVYAGYTGHAECIQIKFDPKVISYKDILYIFFRTHDPTTLNRQGYDVGNEYRSIIFYHDNKQKKTAESLIEELQPEFKNQIMTQLTEFKSFYPAEEHHQDYYKKNPNKPYCVLVIDPKIQKLKKDFAKFLKKK